MTLQHLPRFLLVTNQDSNLEATAPGQLRVIKRNGSVVSYDDSKITPSQLPRPIWL